MVDSPWEHGCSAMSRLSEGPFSGTVYRGLVRQGADAFACNPFRELASLSLHAVLTYPFKTHDVLKRSAYSFTRIRGLPPPARPSKNQGALAPRSPKQESGGFRPPLAQARIRGLWPPARLYAKSKGGNSASPHMQSPLTPPPHPVTSGETRIPSTMFRLRADKSVCLTNGLHSF